LSWEDVLKRGRVPKKPTKEVVDTGFKTEYDNTKPLSNEGGGYFSTDTAKWLRRFKAEQTEKLARKGLPPEAIHWSDEQWEKHYRKVSQKREAREKEEEAIKRRKKAGTHRKKKGQQTNRKPKPSPKKETRGERKKRIAAQKDRQAKKERYDREDAARNERNRRRGL